MGIHTHHKRLKRRIRLILPVFLIFLVIVSCTGFSVADLSGAGQTRTITDMRGVDVTIPDDPQRVVAMSRSLVDTVMYIFGVEDKIVGVII